METTINQRLLAIRKYFKLSQRAFCGKLSLHQATYQPMERDGQDIREVYIKIICQVYNVSEEWFKYGTGEMFTQAPDRQLEELLSIYDSLSPPLQEFLYNQAKELQKLKEKIILPADNI
jgi:transcriptional regulator with XRE-family HTH domain